MVIWRLRNIFDMIATLHLLLNIMGPRRRCSIKSYALKSRYLGHTVQEKWKANKHRRWIRQLVIIQAINGAGAEAAELEEVTEIIILMYIKLTRERRIPRIPIPRLNRTIESISDIEISDCFRFRNRLHLQQLKLLLKAIFMCSEVHSPTPLTKPHNISTGLHIWKPTYDVLIRSRLRRVSSHLKLA